jgi:hypothetical protein
MIRKRFKDAREFIDNMNAIDKRIWVSADDPKNRTFKVVDEHLEYTFEITMQDFIETGESLSVEELECFKSTGERWNLVKDVKISERQKFLLSELYVTGMANYLADKYEVLQKKSLLRLNSTVKVLECSKLPILSIESREKAYCFSENGHDIIDVKSRRMYVPLFEVDAYYSKKYKSIWDIEVEDFIEEDGIFLSENELYNQIVNELGEEVRITLIIRLPLTVLPVTDLVNSEMGFSVFENIGIGIFKSW